MSRKRKNLVDLGVNDLCSGNKHVRLPKKKTQCEDWTVGPKSVYGGPHEQSVWVGSKYISVCYTFHPYIRRYSTLQINILVLRSVCD